MHAVEPLYFSNMKYQQKQYLSWSIFVIMINFYKIVKCHAQKQIGKSHMFNIFIREDMEIEDISLSTAI
jgi:hypothetical protein